LNIFGGRKYKNVCRVCQTNKNNGWMLLSGVNNVFTVIFYEYFSLTYKLPLPYTWFAEKEGTSSISIQSGIRLCPVDKKRREL
jgi:hypothetical protein